MIVYRLSITLNSMLTFNFFFSFLKEVEIRFKEQEHDPLVVEENVSCTKMLSSDLLHGSVSVDIITITIIGFLL